MIGRLADRLVVLDHGRVIATGAAGRGDGRVRRRTARPRRPLGWVVQPVAEGPSGILPEVAARLATSGLRVADPALRRPPSTTPTGPALRRLGLGLLAGRPLTTSSAPTGTSARPGDRGRTGSRHHRLVDGGVPLAGRSPGEQPKNVCRGPQVCVRYVWTSRLPLASAPADLTSVGRQHPVRSAWRWSCRRRWANDSSICPRRR
jgi:hypothetical protein